MSTLAAGSNTSLTVAAGGQVAVSSNGGMFVSVETPVAAAARTTVHGPLAQDRIFGPFALGATLSLTNQTVGNLVYIDTEPVTPTASAITAGSNQAFTLTDGGSLAIASSGGGFWSAAITPAIDPPSTMVHGPASSRRVLGPYAGGASIIVANQSVPTLACVSNTAASSGGGPTPTLSLDFTTGSMPGQVTFARTSTSKAIVGGVFTSLTSGTPAFESWKSTPQGLRLCGAATNQLTFSNVLTNAAWGLSNTTVSAGSDLGPDGATAMAFVAETTANNLHAIKQVITAVPAGTTQTFSCFARKPAGATRFAFGMRISVHFNNAGAQGVFRFDGTPMWFGIASDANVTNVVARMVDLGGGLYFCSLTGTVTSTGDMEYAIHSVWEGNTNGCIPNTTYTGVVTEGPEISSCQVSNTSGSAAYCDNPTTAGANVAAESAIFNDISWFSASAGTFVVEHDCVAGPVIGSGTNTIIAGQPLNPKTGAVKTAIAWDGTGSDLVNNGGATTSGATPTFGADIRLLSTSATANFGHIRSLKYYPQRLSVAQIQALTKPASTASPGSWRVASRCALPSHLDAASGTSNYFCVRVPANILTDMDKLRVDFANWTFPGTANSNAVVIDGCAWERTTGVAETVLFKFGGSQSKTLNGGDTNVVSDDMLPSQFTGLSKFNGGLNGWLRVYYHVPANLNTHPVSRWTAETNVTIWEWDNGFTAPDQPVTATGAISFTGTHIAATRGMAPVLIGVPSASADPKTAIVVGDSRVEGVSGSGGTITGYTFIQKVCDNLGIPSLIFALGGTSQMSVYNTAFWKPYMAYARILIDEMGTNNSNQLIQFGDIWAAARSTYSIDRIVHTGFSPAATSTDNWATAANQTTEKTYPNTIELMLASCGASGLLDVNQVFTTASIRDSGNVSKWNSNGTAFAYANDHIHQSLNGDNAMATELQPFLAALVLT